MKHFFIVNPAAGKMSAEEVLRQKLSLFNGRFSYDVYISNKAADTDSYIQYVRSQEEGHLRFIACGGDGTINELANGMQGIDDVSLGCYASGSGNDYVKYYGQVDDFLELDRLFLAREESVDLMRVGSRMAVNMVDFGFDAKVAPAVEKFRRWPVLGGRNAYTSGIISALLSPMFTPCTVIADGEKLGDGKILLCTLACGSYVGGGYRCAPRSNNADSLMEVCLVKPLSRLRLIKVLSAYKQGLHLDDARLNDVIIYRRAKEVEIKTTSGMNILLDGEITPIKEAKIEVLPKALRFAVPQGL